MPEVMQYFPQVRTTHEGWNACCPRCGDSKWKFYWNVEKAVGCCHHADCPWNPTHGGVTERRLLAFFSRSGVPSATPDLIKAAPEADIKLPEEFEPLNEMENTLLRGQLYSYLDSRGLHKRLVDAARIGYCQTGKFWGYLIFPVFDDEGAVVYWQARRYKDREPKFYNPASSKKTELVYKIGTARKPKRITLVESIINTLTLETGHHQTHDLVMGLFGKTMSPAQREHVLLYDRWLQEIVVALDPDARREAVDIAMQFQGTKKAVKIAEFPEGEDVNSVGREGSWDLVHKALVFDKNRRMEFLLGSR